MFRTLMRSQRRSGKPSEQFFSASHFIHVKPMFEVAWIPFLAGLSGPLQDTDDLETVELCLEGFKAAIHIVCFFDLELERNAFVSTLAKFTFLNNLGEMKTKNMEAIKTLLDVAVTEGNHLKASWREVLTCVSQLEHMQLISSGVDVPDAGRKGSVSCYFCLVLLLILSQSFPQASYGGTGQRESVDTHHCRCRYGVLSEPLPLRSKSSAQFLLDAFLYALYRLPLSSLCELYVMSRGRRSSHLASRSIRDYSVYRSWSRYRTTT